ncbi:hypothetical protein VB715_21260 [Crocosphaera sp. UHCC 0190]|uniref:hypothetical protein n=1 Tax=Crocosphaera sp. UHCC 0190 TaxID=3110246 RepID=UPI002B201B77|nr:hypothetical protein [Crocosphaera sp. UHCC 0190]MEA5512305.1 hypothetical protein [Crocosphaera sp. UHCC 0190]
MTQKQFINDSSPNQDINSLADITNDLPPNSLLSQAKNQVQKVWGFKSYATWQTIKIGLDLFAKGEGLTKKNLKFYFEKEIINKIDEVAFRYNLKIHNNEKELTDTEISLLKKYYGEFSLNLKEQYQQDLKTEIDLKYVRSYVLLIIELYNMLSMGWDDIQKYTSQNHYPLSVQTPKQAITLILNADSEEEFSICLETYAAYSPATSRKHLEELEKLKNKADNGEISEAESKKQRKLLPRYLPKKEELKLPYLAEIACQQSKDSTTKTAYKNYKQAQANLFVERQRCSHPQKGVKALQWQNDQLYIWDKRSSAYVPYSNLDKKE